MGLSMYFIRFHFKFFCFFSHWNNHQTSEEPSPKLMPTEVKPSNREVHYSEWTKSKEWKPLIHFANEYRGCLEVISERSRDLLICDSHNVWGLLTGFFLFVCFVLGFVFFLTWDSTSGVLLFFKIRSSVKNTWQVLPWSLMRVLRDAFH